MTGPEALTRLKRRLKIPNAETSFDDELNEYVTSAVSRLWPRAAQEIDVQTVNNVTVDSYGQASVTISSLTTPLDGVRAIEVGAANYPRAPIDTWRVHANKLRVRGLDSSISQIYIDGLKRYSSVSDVSAEFELGILYLAQSEFYGALAGSKRKYNAYMQSSGTQAVDSMRDMADDYEQRGETYIEERATFYGA